MKINHQPIKVLISFWLLPTLALATPAKFHQLGEVTFGDVNSESQIMISAHAAQTGPGAKGLNARYIATEGDLTFTLPVSPTSPTFVTLKMWGGDVAGEMIATTNGNIKLGAPRADLWAGGNDLDPGDYEILTEKPTLPGRFFYRTFRLPDNLTRGKTNLEMTLKPVQKIGGGYAGGPAAQLVPQGLYSRGYYQAFTHIGNFMPDETSFSNGASAVQVGRQPLDFALLQKRLIFDLDLSTKILMSRQLYGDEFDKAARQYSIPPAVHGLFDKLGLDAYIQLAETNDSDLLKAVTGSGSGRSHTAAGFIFMRAYAQKGSRYYHNPEMISRSIALLDGYRRYQGKNGGYEIGGGDDGWIGGPNRKTADGGLQGFLVGGLAESFLAVWPYVKDSPDIMDARIDSDGDGAPDVTRREAWTAIFHEYLKGQGKMPGGVANQARANAIGATLAHQALHELDPADHTGENNLNFLVKASTGLVPHPRDGGTWMLTRAGVSLEGPGFCPSYGQSANWQFPDLIESYPDQQLRDQFDKELSFFSYMVFPLNGEACGPLLVSGPEGSRHHEYPGKELDYLALVPAAVDFKSPFAGWVVRYMLESSRNLEVSPLSPELGVHLMDEAVREVRCLDELPQLKTVLERPEVKKYTLPTLAPGWENKNDESISFTMLHFGDCTLYLQANHDGRYQFLRRFAQAFGNIDFEETNGVRVILYGSWLVAQNITATPLASQDKGRDAALTTLPAVAEARDLVSGKMMQLNKPLTLTPYTTVIFDLAALGNPEVREISPAQ